MRRLEPGRVLRWTAGIGAALLFWYLFLVWPPPLYYRWFWPRETAFMAMRDHREVRPPAAEEARRVPRHSASVAPPRAYRPVPLDSISPWLARAALVGEDNRFFEHRGLDVVELRKALGYPRDDFHWGETRDREALRRALGRAWSRRDRLRGASTITQQLAKNLYLSPSRNPLRKVKEALLAWRLETALGKRRILELYLNVAEFGDNVWGAEAAARSYFGTSARNLTREQAAALAASLPFPLRSNPGYRPGRMRWRQQLILRRLRGERLDVPKDDEEIERQAPLEDAGEGSVPPVPAPAPDSAPPPAGDSVP